MSELLVRRGVKLRVCDGPNRIWNMMFGVPRSLAIRLTTAAMLPPTLFPTTASQAVDADVLAVSGNPLRRGVRLIDPPVARLGRSSYSTNTAVVPEPTTTSRTMPVRRVVVADTQPSPEVHEGGTCAGHVGWPDDDELDGLAVAGDGAHTTSAFARSPGTLNCTPTSTARASSASSAPAVPPLAVSTSRNVWISRWVRHFPLGRRSYPASCSMRGHAS